MHGMNNLKYVYLSETWYISTRLYGVTSHNTAILKKKFGV